MPAERCDPPARQFGAPEDAFAPHVPVEVYAAFGLSALYGGMAYCDLDDAIRLSDDDWRARRTSDIDATGNPDASIDLHVSGGRDSVHHLDWWLHSYEDYWRDAPPWKPFAGQLKIEVGLVALINTVAAWDVHWDECLNIGGYDYYDWSGLDPARTYNTLSVGFAPNRHPKIKTVGWPLLTILACIGLQYHPLQRLRDSSGARLFDEVRYGLPPDIGKMTQRIFSAPLVFRGNYIYSADVAQEIGTEAS
jgi:hypothetical protein